jgi:hypothetical protein
VKRYKWHYICELLFETGRVAKHIAMMAIGRSPPLMMANGQITHKGLRTEETRVVGKGQRTFAVDRLHRRRETESIDA